MHSYPISKEYGLFARFFPPFNRLAFAAASLLLGLLPAALKSDGAVTLRRERIRTADGHALPLVLFVPVNRVCDKLILYLHGGGFAFKGYTCHYRLCRRFAEQCGCTVVYVDYRLCPGHPYPAGLDDCFCAYSWVVQNAARLGVDPQKIIVGGDSAGGCLAVDLTRRALRESAVKPRFQLLIYPVLDSRMQTPSMLRYTDTPMWNARLNRKMWRLYLNGRAYTSPAEAAELAAMPPTYIETAEFDCLHDEGVAFAASLRQSGVPVELNETAGTMHGYDAKRCPTTERAIRRRIDALNRIV